VGAVVCRFSGLVVWFWLWSVVVMLVSLCVSCTGLSTSISSIALCRPRCCMHHMRMYACMRAADATLIGCACVCRVRGMTRESFCESCVATDRRWRCSSMAARRFSYVCIYMYIFILCHINIHIRTMRSQTRRWRCSSMAAKRFSCVCVYIYIYISCVCVCVCIYIYIYI
jgi:hypothetical protein